MRRTVAVGVPSLGSWAVLGEKLRGLEGTVPCLAAYSESAGSDLRDPHIKLGARGFRIVSHAPPPDSTFSVH